MYYVAKPLWLYELCDWHTLIAPEADKWEAVSVWEACRLCVSGLVRQAPCASDKSVKPSKQRGIRDDISICEDLDIFTVMIRLGPLCACISVWRTGATPPYKSLLADVTHKQFGNKHSENKKKYFERVKKKHTFD